MIFFDGGFWGGGEHICIYLYISILSNSILSFISNHTDIISSSISAQIFWKYLVPHLAILLQNPNTNTLKPFQALPVVLSPMGSESHPFSPSASWHQALMKPGISDGKIPCLCCSQLHCFILAGFAVASSLLCLLVLGLTSLSCSKISPLDSSLQFSSCRAWAQDCSALCTF